MCRQNRDSPICVVLVVVYRCSALQGKAQCLPHLGSPKSLGTGKDFTGIDVGRENRSHREAPPCLLATAMTMPCSYAAKLLRCIPRAPTMEALFCCADLEEDMLPWAWAWGEDKEHPSAQRKRAMRHRRHFRVSDKTAERSDSTP